ncbi:MAG: hypothetical protein ACK4UN_06715, partial [Limisphaerales bacterium]
GRTFYGSPSGANVTSLSETVTTNFLAGPNTPVSVKPPQAIGGTVTLVWNAAEGGTYQVLASSDLNNWNSKAANLPAATNTMQTTVSRTAPVEFYRINRTALATYDPVVSTNATSNGITSISPASGNRSSTVVAVITLSNTASPAVPPIQAPVNSVTIGSIPGTNVSRPTQYTIQATFNIPSGALTGPQTVTVVFPGPPDNPTNTVTYTLTNGFTIN